ncbi:MAG: hypothetical protein IJP77_09250 [Bacteroidales bacterium]|nr:hypothetical protein [Bacteroidales bacterium]
MMGKAQTLLGVNLEYRHGIALLRVRVLLLLRPKAMFLSSSPNLAKDFQIAIPMVKETLPETVKGM